MSVSAKREKEILKELGWKVRRDPESNDGHLRAANYQNIFEIKFKPGELVNAVERQLAYITDYSEAISCVLQRMMEISKSSGERDARLFLDSVDQLYRLLGRLNDEIVNEIREAK